MYCHLGISGLALQVLQKMLHKESKNLPAVEMQPQKMSKGRFQPNALVKQGRNQISEGHVCCFKGSSYSLVMCLRERQVTRVLGVFCLV